jgi:hypothetical protein
MTRRNSRPAVLHLRKLKGELGTNLPSLSRAKLTHLIEEAVVNAYTEEEQAAGFFTMIEEHLALPFPVKILGVDADVEKVDMTLDGQIVAICQPRLRQAWNGLQLIAAGAEVRGERISVLRFSCPRPSAYRRSSEKVFGMPGLLMGWSAKEVLLRVPKRTAVWSSADRHGPFLPLS